MDCLRYLETGGPRIRDRVGQAAGGSRYSIVRVGPRIVQNRPSADVGAVDEVIAAPVLGHFDPGDRPVGCDGGLAAAPRGNGSRSRGRLALRPALDIVRGAGHSEGRWQDSRLGRTSGG